MPCTPGALVLLILSQAAIGIVDAAIENQFGGACFQAAQREFAKQRYRIVIQLAPADGVKVKEQVDRIVVPAPPQVARYGPQAFLCRCNEAVEGARLTDDGRHLIGGLGQHADFVFRENPRLDGLYDQDTLKHSSVDQGNAEKRLESVFTRFLEILEAWMSLHLLHSHRANLLRNQAGESFLHRHAESADAFAAQSK